MHGMEVQCLVMGMDDLSAFISALGHLDPSKWGLDTSSRPVVSGVPVVFRGSSLREGRTLMVLRHPKKLPGQDE